MNLDPISPWWPALYTALGGVLAFGGQLFTEWFRSRREAKATKRDQRRQQLYAVQDQIIVLFELTRREVSNANDPFNPAGALFIDRNPVRNAVTKIGIQSVRVGDDPLGGHISALSSALYSAIAMPSEASARIREAHSHLYAAQERIGRLLHTDIEIDTGDEKKGRWRPKRNANTGQLRS